MIGRDDILKVLGQADRLPPFPDVVTRLETELSSPNVSNRRISSLLAQDAVLVSKLLRVANSAYYVGNQNIASVDDAIVRLGFRELRRLVYSASIIGRYQKLGKGVMPRFWEHSLSVALASRAMCDFCKQPVAVDVQEAAYVAGLLHDLGAIVLMHWFPEDYRHVVAGLRAEGGLASDHESKLFGIEHGEVGGILAAQWALPPGIQQAIMCHHQPWRAVDEQRSLVRLVHIADFICNNQGYGREEFGSPHWFDPEAWDFLGLGIDDIQAIIGRVRAEANRSIIMAKALVS